MDQEFEKITRKIRKQAWELNNNFKLIDADDLVMVCLSGGKDSYTMLDVLLNMQKAIPFRLIAVNLDQKQPDFPEHILPEYLSSNNIPFKIYEKDTYSVVIEKTPAGKTMCSMCSRLRRGNLYSIAEELGATKIALGHHKDDVLETFFLNLFFSGKLEAMPAKFLTDDKKHIVIRPLANTREKEIMKYASYREFPIIPCNLCGSQPNLQRNIVKKMISQWEEQYPDRVEIMFNAISNVSPSHLFDPTLFDFASLQSSSMEKLKDINTVKL
ncbi:tRNA 2-thiocytidine(32) synthetase TtcA [Chryseosolibacter indicus]|uniref:tRNA-cytidine(32) 2-sulfurtransferase n=1 Tax=Chryseosolibacter indicus TaxID=2782351 RepID=A0ABS5VJQ7_9BACT|nr:tRNA 2-thiocytidine(32) synthetase TtcA [Chryseosolibacter indicus]MBT1701680.1 tRNA 2-thiocytidine(32) synthetase TtcA [Chryseosolibacter indicus]